MQQLFRRCGLAGLVLLASIEAGATGSPPGLSGLTGPLQSVPLLGVTVSDLPRLIDEAAAGPPQPRAFAAAGQERWPLASGRWEPLNDGRWVWRSRARGAGAESLHFRLDGLSLPDEATLFVYAPDGGDVRGPYTAQDVRAGTLWTPVVRGSEAILEILVPAAQREMVELQSIQPYYGFFAFWREDSAQPKEGSCHLDVACPQAQVHAQQVRAVARIQLEMNALLSATCTANLMNNSRQDRRPLMLTANHCINTAAQASSVVVYWNFQRSACGSGTSALNQTQQGATLRANSIETDFSLIELAGLPPASFNVFYTGWNRAEGVPASTFVIHHPEGTEKRYSEDFQPPVVTNLPCVAGCPPGLPLPPPRAGAPGSALQVVDYDIGVTEPGSSGAGLFDPQGLLIGQLSQGASACGNDESDWYGRLAQSWEGEGSTSTRLRDWLDPAGTGGITLVGLESAGSGPAGTGGGAGGNGGTGATGGGGAAGSGGGSGAGGSAGSAGATGGSGAAVTDTTADSSGGCTLRPGQQLQRDAGLIGLVLLALMGLASRSRGRRA